MPVRFFEHLLALKLRETAENRLAPAVAALRRGFDEGVMKVEGIVGQDGLNECLCLSEILFGASACFQHLASAPGSACELRSELAAEY